MNGKKELLEALRLLYYLYTEDDNPISYYLCIYTDDKEHMLGDKYDIIKEWIDNILIESYHKYELVYTDDIANPFPLKLLEEYLPYDYSLINWKYKARIKLLEAEIAKLAENMDISAGGY